MFKTGDNCALQIEDILVGDKQLAKEIMYDMKQAELAREDEASTAMVQGAPAQQSSGLHPQAQAGPSGEAASAARLGSGAASPRAGLSPRGVAANRHRHSILRRSSSEAWPQAILSTACFSTAVQSLHLQNSAGMQYSIVVKTSSSRAFHL